MSGPAKNTRARRQAIALTIAILAVLVPALALTVEAERADWLPLVAIAMAGGMLGGWILVPPGQTARRRAVAMAGGAFTAACAFGTLYAWVSVTGRGSGRGTLVGLGLGALAPAALSLYVYERVQTITRRG